MDKSRASCNLKNNPSYHHHHLHSSKPLFLMSTKKKTFLLILLTFFFPIFHCQNDTTLQQGQQLRDWETLTSQNGLFRIQFFSLANSPNRYLGIFYNLPSNPDWMLGANDRKAVWVANRNTPIPDASGSIGIDSNGSLTISYNLGGSPISIVLSSAPATGNVTASLLNNGNFVMRELSSNGSVGRLLWESFDYPTDTLLPGMKLGINFRTGHIWSLTSWISDVLPASGSFTFGGDPNNTTQLIIWWKGNISWVSGPWENGRFENAQRLSIEPGHQFTYVSNADEKYFMYSINRNRTYNIPPRYVMGQDGYVEQAFMMAPFGQCFRTNISAPVPPGCEEHGWPECRRRNYWFFILRQGTLSGPGFRYSESSNMSLFDCETACRNNCSCTAYAATSHNKTGCTLYGKGRTFRSSVSSLDEAYILNVDKEAWFKVWMIWLCIGLAPIVLILLCSSCCIVRRRIRLKGEKKKDEQRLLHELEINTASTPYDSIYTKDEKISDELKSFSFETIADATNKFHSSNKLGEGGFGPVYKARLLDEQEIAIKRLSRRSGQGLEEFKNEILLIAKLQHTNLVRLLGFCIQGQEKMLIYEYMPNKSLDFFLFNPGEKEVLKWTTRFNIIEGIAQGLLYLHKYSRLRIIHRDLKASNILLDHNFNPKISDFGMARIFGVNESEANTNRVVGTYGYMSPEYAMKGIFSMKSDVYSFGVLLLEIVSGRRNNSNYHSDRQLNLIGLAWELWNEGRAIELIDLALDNECSRNQVLRCIQVSLLCAHNNATDRPSMSDIVLMLTNETMQLPAPKQPAFFIGTSSSLEDDESRKDDPSGTHSVNGLTISMVQGR